MIVNPHNFLKRLILWLDPSYGKTGATLSSWLDKSSSNNNASQPTAGARPTDNTTYVSFDGGDNMIVADDDSLDMKDKMTLYAQIRTSSVNNLMGIYDKFIGSTSGFAFFLDNNKRPQIVAQLGKTSISLVGTSAVNNGAIRKVHATIECSRKFFNQMFICNGAEPQILKVGSTYYLYYGKWDGAQYNIYVRSDTSPYFENSSETLLISNAIYCSIMKDGSTYRLIITDIANANFTLYTSNLPTSGFSSVGVVLSKDAEFAIADPHEIKIGSTYYLYYSGFTSGTVGTVKYATSATGAPASYTKQGESIAVGGSGTFDVSSTYDPDVILLEDGLTYLMIYTGFNSTYGKLQQGFATSADGITWTKFANNPVFAFTGQSYQAGLYGSNEPCLLVENGILRMWYRSDNASAADFKIGYTEWNMTNDTTPYAGSETVATNIYVDNVLEATDTKTSALGIDHIVPNTHDLYVGGDNTSTFLFVGDIFEAKIWHDIKTTV